MENAKDRENMFIKKIVVGPVLTWSRNVNLDKGIILIYSIEPQHHNPKNE
jgi:hypothetical protein